MTFLRTSENVMHQYSVDEPTRSRTWNLLIRSQTRYPLRHRPNAHRRLLAGMNDIQSLVP